MMNRSLYSACATAVVLMLAACGNSDVSDSKASAVTAPAREPAASGMSPSKSEPGYDATVAKPGSPFVMKYRVIGTPIVGSPVTIDLRVESLLGPRPITVDYRINDSAAMSLHEAQPDRVRIAPAENESFIAQRVTVVPQREGRIYLNVSASYETDEGSASAIMAVPIQVGAGGRELQENGELQLDENGEPVRVLTSE